MWRFFPLSDAGPDIEPIERQWLLERSSCQLDKRGIPINHMRKSINSTACFDVPVPRGKRTSVRASFVKSGLAAAQRSIARHHTGPWAAVVAGKNEKRVGAAAAVVHGSHNLPDHF